MRNKWIVSDEREAEIKPLGLEKIGNVRLFFGFFFSGGRYGSTLAQIQGTVNYPCVAIYIPLCLGTLLPIAGRAHFAVFARASFFAQSIKKFFFLLMLHAN